MKFKHLAGLCLSGTLFVACGSQETSKQEVIDLDAQSQEVKEKLSFSNNVATTDEVTIAITDYKVIPAGGEGNPTNQAIIGFWYTVTNLTDNEFSPSTAWLYTFSAKQQTGNPETENLTLGGTPDAQFTDSQFTSIKKDEMVSNAVFYTLADTEHAVSLTAHNGFVGDEIGQQEFTLK